MISYSMFLLGLIDLQETLETETVIS